MSASELFKAGRLQEAIDAQIQEVKANPADPSKRLFLFELLAFAGDLERAKKQIDALRFDQPELAAAVQDYRKILDAEQARRRLFREGAEPKFLVPPGDHVRLRMEAVGRLRDQQPAEAAELLTRAADASPPLTGFLNNKPFALLRDADDLFGPVLEVFAKGVYSWVPLEQVDSLAMNPPRFPRDLLWFPARLTIREGPSGEVFLPNLYPASHEHSIDSIKLGRETDWQAAEGGPVRGMGARTFLVGDDAVGLLEWRELQMAG
jgi:type VI secretion system protein ImpE